MPVVEASAVVPLPPDLAFAVSQTTGAVRLRWDRFIRRQQFLDGVDAAGKGVRTLTVQRSGLRMVSEYVSYRPPTSVGMKMIDGPWFFEKMGGGWRFEPAGEGTRAVWRYNFSCRPAWLAPLAEWIGTRVLQREIDRRIAGFAAGCADPVVVEAARRAVLRPG
ncbi:type II toxin-antitoxin system RatA family toxin [Microbacterium kyungheense]|uniref:Polyketide cyclase/dehydrase/lipid transport protein n=1 Tax=Microbacterium kyungheense TaxID=1263636 RepID=A0A543FJX2_9MICO|nr:SRPBCC family protein [Microbacterium kyungheense]TQM34158.1 polyketide cyclase/dehydrase/lipid transport protein [Microbacterium kyungheense]